MARIHAAQEQLVQGGSAAAAVEEAQAALAAGLPAGAATNATFLALVTLELGEQYDQALRWLDVALEGARHEGHATRQGLIHGRRAAIALAQGSLHDAQVEAETGLLLVENQHFALLQLLAVAMVVQIERGELAAAAELAQTGEELGIAEDRLYVDQFLIARGRLRIAEGHVREGVADLMWCGERLEAYDVPWPGRLEGVRGAGARLARRVADGRRACPGAPRHGSARRRTRGVGTVTAQRRAGDRWTRGA